MKQLFPVQRKPFGLLLYLEWILLGITVLTEIVPNPMGRSAHSPMITIVLIGLLGFMGLRLPTEGKTLHKILYTALEFGLIFLPTLLSSGFIRLFPLLYLVVVIRSCSMFQPPGRLAVAGLALSCFLLTMLQIQDVPARHSSERQQSDPSGLHQPSAPRPHPPDDPEPQRPLSRGADGMTQFTLRLHATLTFGLTLVFVLLLVNALLTERKIREQLAIANEQLRQYALRIENQATLQERNRIAREIHDSLGHLLTAQSIQLENALLFLPPQAAKTESFLTEARQLGTSALQEVRQSVSSLRSDPLHGKSLAIAIAQVVKNFQQTTDITPTVSNEARSSLPTDVSTAIYRILQEALTNIAKHAAATNVSLHLWEHSDGIHLVVEDNGTGFHPDQNTTGFGLKSMRERTIVLGGQCTITSQPQTGCQIAVVIPLSRQS